MASREGRLSVFAPKGCSRVSVLVDFSGATECLPPFTTALITSNTSPHWPDEIELDWAPMRTGALALPHFRRGSGISATWIGSPSDWRIEDGLRRKPTDFSLRIGIHGLKACSIRDDNSSQIAAEAFLLDSQSIAEEIRS